MRAAIRTCIYESSVRGAKLCH